MTTQTINLRELAVEIDTILAGLYEGQFFHATEADFLNDQVRRAAGQTRTETREGRFGPIKYGPWSDTMTGALMVIDALPESSDPWSTSARAKKLAAEYRHHKAQLAQIEIERTQANEVYAEYQWNRAFLVINSNGHVHNGMDCSTCFPTTRYEWLVHYSAADEGEIVADAGEMACTVCYPSAPAEVLNRPANLVSKSRAEKDAAKAQRAAEKAEREAKRLAKAATIDGSTLLIPDDFWPDRVERIDTEYAAKREWNSDQAALSREIDATYAHDPAQYIAEMEVRRERMRVRQSLIEHALAVKHGTTPEEVREDLLKRYAKRRPQ